MTNATNDIRMARRRLGRTELDVSVIGVGTIPLARVSREDGVRVVRRALDLGVNFIDTARCYGRGGAEETVGEAISGRPREEVFVLTRSERRDADVFAKDIEESCERLRSDYVDIHEIHDVSSPELFEKVKADGLLEVQAEAKRRGRIRHAGISSHGSPELITEMIRSGMFDVVTVAHNLIGHKRMARDGDHTGSVRETVLPAAAELDVGVTVMKPLAGGVLTKPSEKILSLMKDRGGDAPVTNAVSALLFAIADPRIHVACPGMRSIREVEENVLAGDPARQLSEDELAALLEEAVKWGEGLCRYCGYCLPCTEKISIPDVLRFEGYYTRYGLTDWARAQYARAKVKASECSECGDCEERCPYDLPIRERLAAAHELLSSEE